MRAHADDASEYESGRELYVKGKHAEAEQFFAQAIDGPTPTIQDPLLIARGRMIRGASDMYLGRRADAIAQFELILRTSPQFDPDPIAFPPGVLEEFQRTRDRLRKETTEKEKVAAVTRELEAERTARAKMEAQLDALRSFAREERVVTSNSRLIATIPFGVGQFQNGDVALGVVFAASEVLALGSATVAYGIHESIPRQPDDVDKARSVEISSRTVNLISLGAFAALVIGGVVQAHVLFVPERVDKRNRALPAGLVGWTPVVEPTVAGGVVGLSAAF